ncbi:MAG TPA: hypothetical protein VMU32_04720 [Solirubrobacteraceae bacterium]|nr:hypothetical protein [Solirubrobacteraceae bacterium]
MSATAADTRAERVRSLPTLSQAARFIGLDTGGMSRTVRALGVEAQRWGRRDKHLEIGQVLQIARVAQRASLEEVAGSILEWTEQNHPDALRQTTAEIDAFFAELPPPVATPADEFLAELHGALPPRWADRAEEIWRAHAGSV